MLHNRHVAGSDTVKFIRKIFELSKNSILRFKLITPESFKFREFFFKICPLFWKNHFLIDFLILIKND